MEKIVKQYYDIKFPFTDNQNKGFFIDLNETFEEAALSQLVHVILTPKGTKLRHPEFGTDLLKFIFQPNDQLTKEKIKSEIRTAVNTYVKGVQINDFEVKQQADDDHTFYLQLDYTVQRGNAVNSYINVIKIV